MKKLEEVLQIINQTIEEIDWQRKPIGLYEPIEYILSLGGKRIRPAICLMAANLFSDDITPAIKPAIGLEIFHNFTLLHDDIMDRADMRRGKPTVHVKWSDNTAILSGDVMQIEAYKWVAESPSKHLKEVLDLFSLTAAEICEGQQYDMEFENRNDVSIDEYLEMIRLKTAVLIAAGCKIGAIVSGASKEDAEQLYEFGHNIGMAFQLKDDLLDVYGDEQKFGKKIGGDILCNKKTYLLIHSLNKAEDENKKALDYWLSIDETKQEKINAVTTLYNSLGAKAACEEKINEYYQKAIKNLEEISTDNAKKGEMSNLLQSLMDRAD